MEGSASQLGRRTDRSTRVLASTASLRSEAIGRESVTGESAVNGESEEADESACQSEGRTSTDGRARFYSHSAADPQQKVPMGNNSSRERDQRQREERVSPGTRSNSQDPLDPRTRHPSSERSFNSSSCPSLIPNSFASLTSSTSSSVRRTRRLLSHYHLLFLCRTSGQKTCRAHRDTTSSSTHVLDRDVISKTGDSADLCARNRRAKAHTQRRYAA